MTIVYSVGFRNGAGELLEETLLPVAVEYGGRRWRHRRSALRAQVRAAARGRWRRFSIQPSRPSPAPGSRQSRPHTATTCPRARRAGGRCRGPLPSTAGVLVQPGLFGRAGLRTEQKPPTSALLDEAPIEEAAERQIVWQARVEAVICGSLA